MCNVVFSSSSLFLSSFVPLPTSILWVKAFFSDGDAHPHADLTGSALSPGDQWRQRLHQSERQALLPPHCELGTAVQRSQGSSQQHHQQQATGRVWWEGATTTHLQTNTLHSALHAECMLRCIYMTDCAIWSHKFKWNRNMINPEWNYVHLGKYCNISPYPAKDELYCMYLTNFWILRFGIVGQFNLF